MTEEGRIDGMATTSRTAGIEARSIALHALAAALMFVSPLVLFAPAALLHSGLRNGRKGLWLSAVGAGLLLALLAPVAGTPRALTPTMRMLFEVGVPSGIGLEMIRRGVLLGPALLATVGAAFGGFMLVELVMRGVAEFSPYHAIVENFRTASASSMDAYRASGFPEQTIATMEKFSAALAGSYMPAVLGVITILTFALSFVMLPRLRAGKVLIPGYLFRTLRYPDPLLFAFVAGGLAPLAPGLLRTAGFNLLAVVAVLYMLQGLAVARFLHARSRIGLLGTVLAMMSLAFLALYGIAPMILFMVGLFDPFFDFRKIHRKEAPHESDSD